MRVIWIILPAFFLGACEGILNLDLVGDGNRASQQRSVSFFSSVEVLDDFVVEIYESELRFLEVDADANLLAFVETENDNGALLIKRKDNFNLLPRQPIIVRVYSPNYNKLRNSGGAKMVIGKLSLSDLSVVNSGKSNLIADSLEVRTLDFFTEGGSNSQVNGNFERAVFRQIGSGNLVLKGSSEFTSILQEGSGKVEAYNLNSRLNKVNLFGSGIVYCRATDSLFVEMDGSGRVFYRGRPNVESSLKGEGVLINAGD